MAATDGGGGGGASQLLAVRLSEAGTVTLEDGTLLLRGLDGRVWQSGRAAGGKALVLGLHSTQGRTSLIDCVLGQVDCHRYLALTRLTLWWMFPLFSSWLGDLPPETQFLLLELRPGGPYATLLPLLDDGRFRAQLLPVRGRGVPPRLGVRVESGTGATQATSWAHVLLAAAGHDPFELIDAAVVAAGALSGGARPRQEKEVPDSINWLGYCTWDASYTRVSPKAIVKGLASLEAGGCRPRLLIIDDGWQMTRCDPQHGTGSDGATFLTAAKSRAALHRPLTRQLSKTRSGLGERALLEQGLDIVAAGDLRGSQTIYAAIEEQEELEAPGEWLTRRLPLQAVQRRLRGKRLLLLVSDFLQDLVAGLLSWLAAFVLLLIKLWLQGAAYNSWQMRGFVAVVRGPLRPLLIKAYASASHHTQRLSGVAANSKFATLDSGPDEPPRQGADLAGVVRGLKERFGLRYVYCWHALAGYWGGVIPDAEMAKYNSQVLYPRANPTLREVDPWFAWNQFVLAGSGIVEDSSLLHNDMHRYLSNCGVDGIKVDVQSQVGLCGSALQGGPLLSGAYHASLEASVREHFPGNHCINCMCHCTEDLYRFEATAVARMSDDFYPRLPPSWLPHIAICAFNSLFLGALAQPDFDMWQSKHPVAGLHAAARAVSGGPVYVADKPGQHDFNLLRRLALPDGSILRAQLPGRPTRDCLLADVSRDGRTALKIWNMNEVNGVVGVFNLQGSAYDRRQRQFVIHNPRPPTLATAVSPADVEPFRPGSAAAAAAGGAPASEFAVYSDASKRVTVLAAGGSLSVSVPGGGWDLVTIAPIKRALGVGVAPLGLPGMLNAGGAVKSFALRVTKHPPSTPSTHSLGGGGTAAATAAGDRTAWAGSTAAPGAAAAGAAAGAEAEEEAGAGLGLFEPGSPSASFMGAWRPAVAKLMTELLVQGCGTFLLYCTRCPQAVRINDQGLGFEWDRATCTAAFELPEQAVLLNEVQVLF